MIASIDVQDEDVIANSVDVDEVTLTEDEIGNLFQYTSSEEDLVIEGLQCSVIGCLCNNKDVVAYTTLLTVWLQVCF